MILLRRKWIEAIICAIVFGYMFTQQTAATTPDILLKVATNENEIITITNSELFISGNEDFHQKAIEWGWSGTGEELTPYIIENFDFQGPITTIPWPRHLIKIENVSFHFIIQNCNFSNVDQQGCGIFLDHVSHAVITKNYFQNNSRGISLEKCTEIKVTHNYLFDNSGGIDVGYSHASQTIVISNNILNASRGIGLYYSTGIVVDKNIINHSGEYEEGIGLSCSSENVITDNVLINSSIFFSGSVDDGYGNPSGEEKDTLQISVKGNMIHGKPLIYYQEEVGKIFQEDNVGKVIFNACNDVQLLNQHSSNTYTQFDFIRCQDITILNCSFSQIPVVPIRIRYTDYFKLENNVFSNCPRGVSLYMSSFGNIVKNEFISNQGGISAYAATQCIFSDNHLSKNVDHGINLHTCSSNQISQNCLSENDKGLCILSSARITIINNVFVNNTSTGIYGHLNDLINITNNVISSTGLKSNATWSGIGILLSNAYDCFISNNNISNNRNYGISLAISKNTKVVNNNFINNNPNGTSQAYSRWIYYGGKYNRSFDNFSHNYWSDWISPDNNEDGIVDVPYPIYCEGEINYTDSYPLVKPLNNTFYVEESTQTSTTSNKIEGWNLINLVLIMTLISSIKKRRKF